jgi:cobalamin biosynthesis protein CbiD
MFVRPAATTASTAAAAAAEAFYSSLNQKVEILIPNLLTPLYNLRKLVPDK